MFEASAKLPTGILRDYGPTWSLLCYISQELNLSTNTAVSSQTRKATACCCLLYQILNEIDQNRILNDIHSAIPVKTSQCK